MRVFRHCLSRLLQMEDEVYVPCRAMDTNYFCYSIRNKHTIIILNDHCCSTPSSLNCQERRTSWGEGELQWLIRFWCKIFGCLDKETLSSKTVAHSSSSWEGEEMVDCNVVKSSYKGEYRYVVRKQESRTNKCSLNSCLLSQWNVPISSSVEWVLMMIISYLLLKVN